MDSVQSKPASAAGNTVELDAAVELIRAGDVSGLRELRRILTPGVRLLIGLRMGRRGAAKEAKAVLEEAAQRIQRDGSLRASGVISMVRQLIVERRPGKRQLARSGQLTSGGPRVQVAAKVVRQLSPLEREALRRCYVLGEMPEQISQELQLSPEQFLELRSRARAAFSSEVVKKTHVA